MKGPAGALRASRMDAERTEQPGCARAALRHVGRWQRSPARATERLPRIQEFGRVRPSGAGLASSGPPGCVASPSRRSPSGGAGFGPWVRSGAGLASSGPPGCVASQVAGRPLAGPASDPGSDQVRGSLLAARRDAWHPKSPVALWRGRLGPWVRSGAGLASSGPPGCVASQVAGRPLAGPARTLGPIRCKARF